MLRGDLRGGAVEERTTGQCLKQNNTHGIKVALACTGSTRDDFGCHVAKSAARGGIFLPSHVETQVIIQQCCLVWYVLRLTEKVARLDIPVDIPQVMQTREAAKSGSKAPKYYFLHPSCSVKRQRATCDERHTQVTKLQILPQVQPQVTNQVGMPEPSAQSEVLPERAQGVRRMRTGIQADDLGGFGYAVFCAVNNLVDM